MEILLEAQRKMMRAFRTSEALRVSKDNILLQEEAKTEDID